MSIKAIFEFLGVRVPEDPQHSADHQSAPRVPQCVACHPDACEGGSFAGKQKPPSVAEKLPCRIAASAAASINPTASESNLLIPNGRPLTRRMNVLTSSSASSFDQRFAELRAGCDLTLLDGRSCIALLSTGGSIQGSVIWCPIQKPSKRARYGKKGRNEQGSNWSTRPKLRQTQGKLKTSKSPLQDPVSTSIRPRASEKNGVFHECVLAR